MIREQLKVNVSDLIPGMFVSALDRPWIETPFPLEGFHIRTQDDVDELRRFCEYVFIDVVRGLRPLKADLPVQRLPPRPASSPVRVRVKPLKIRRDAYAHPVALKKEVPKAVPLYQKATELVDELMEKVRVGEEVPTAALKRVVSSMVDSIVRNPEALLWLSRIRHKDEYIYGHAIRTCIWAIVFGRHLGLSQAVLQVLALGVLLSDVGKTRLPRALVTQAPEKLSTAEQDLVKKHVHYGIAILKRTEGIDDGVVSIVATHHERHDGSGYPRGLKGDEIPYLGKIAGIVDRYDLMRYPRDDKPALSPAEAMTWLYELRNTEFQEELICEFIQAIGIYPAGTLVELTSGEIAIVMEQNPQRRLQPKVTILLDADKQPLSKPRQVDLYAQDGDPPSTISRAVEAQTFGLEPEQIHEACFGRRWFG